MNDLLITSIHSEVYIASQIRGWLTYSDRSFSKEPANLVSKHKIMGEEIK